MRGANGQLIAVVGPSGSGKDTLLDGLIRACPRIHRARRTISRPPSVATEDFVSVSAAEFSRLRGSDAFAVHWTAHGLHYGIQSAELSPLEEGRTVVFNGSRGALPDIAARFPSLKVVVIAVAPEILATRLAARGRESVEEIAGRLRRAAFDLPDGIEHVTISNDGTPDEGVAALVAALQPLSA